MNTQYKYIEEFEEYERLRYHGKISKFQTAFFEEGYMPPMTINDSKNLSSILAILAWDKERASSLDNKQVFNYQFARYSFIRNISEIDLANDSNAKFKYYVQILEMPVLYKQLINHAINQGFSSFSYFSDIAIIKLLSIYVKMNDHLALLFDLKLTMDNLIGALVYLFIHPNISLLKFKNQLKNRSATESYLFEKQIRKYEDKYYDGEYFASTNLMAICHRLIGNKKLRDYEYIENFNKLTTCTKIMYGIFYKKNIENERLLQCLQDYPYIFFLIGDTSEAFMVKYLDFQDQLKQKVKFGRDQYIITFLEMVTWNKEGLLLEDIDIIIKCGKSENELIHWFLQHK